MMRRIRLVLSLAFVAALVVFVVQNLESVKLSFLTWESSMSLAVPVIAAYVAGAVSGKPLWRMLRRQREEQKAQKKATQDAQKKAEAQAKQDAAAQATSGQPSV